MLEIRTICENCGKHLPNNSDAAMICSYECTFCKECVEHILFNVCPNCGGGFESRPTRPIEMLKKDPEKKDGIYKPVKENKYLTLMRYINPRKR